MDQPGRLGRRSRWVASAGALVVAGAVLAATVMASAAAPALPRRTPAQMLVDMRHATLPSAMTAVITQSANLGFPALPDIPGLSSSSLSAASLITGTHTVDIWYAGPQHVRIALPASFAETDLRVNGHQIWLWDSKSQTATHYILPATLRPPGPFMGGPAVFCAQGHGVPVPRAILRLRMHGLPVRLRRVMLRAFRAHMRGVPLRLAALCARGHLVLGGKAAMGITIVPGTGPGSAAKSQQATSSAPPVAPSTPLVAPSAPLVAPSAPGMAELTPLQAADRLLAMVGPTTKVTVPGTVTVAGRPAYQLAIAPRSSSSLIGQIVIAVDAKTYLPLQVQVFARGLSSPAFQVGFTSLTIGQPAMSNFTFTPPPGAKVKTERLPGTLPGFAGIGLPFGGLPFGPGAMAAPGGTGAIVVPGGPGRVPPKITKLQRRMIRLGMRSTPLGSAALRKALKAARNGGGFLSRVSAGPRVLGSGWLSVLVLPTAPVLTGVTSGGGPRGLAESAAYQSSVTYAYARPGPPSPVAVLLRTLLNAATRVHGSWGSGRLLTTSLFSVLLTSKGDVLIGAVTPAVLYADAAKVK